MIAVDVLFRGYAVDSERIVQTVRRALVANGILDNAEVCVVICGSLKMKKLHKEYMETYEETDVLSFPLEESVGVDGVLHLGDVVVCYPVAARQAAENGRSVDEEIDFLVDHGCLHLMGIHHE